MERALRYRRRRRWSSPVVSCTSSCGTTGTGTSRTSARRFLANVIASAVVAVALVVTTHWAAVVAGLAVVNGTLVAFALSRTDRGIFDFTERGFEPSPEAVLALVFEIGAGVVLVVLLGLDRSLRSPG